MTTYKCPECGFITKQDKSEVIVYCTGMRSPTSVRHKKMQRMVRQ